MRVYTSSDEINEDIFTADAGKRTIEYSGQRVVYQLESKPWLVNLYAKWKPLQEKAEGFLMMMMMNKTYIMKKNYHFPDGIGIAGKL